MGCVVSVATAQLCHYSWNAATGAVYMNECACVSIKLTLQKQVARQMSSWTVVCQPLLYIIVSFIPQIALYNRDC